MKDRKDGMDTKDAGGESPGLDPVDGLTCAIHRPRVDPAHGPGLFGVVVGAPQKPQFLHHSPRGTLLDEALMKMIELVPLGYHQDAHSKSAHDPAAYSPRRHPLGVRLPHPRPRPPPDTDQRSIRAARSRCR